MEQWRGNIWRQYDDPGGTEEELQNDSHLSSKNLTNRTNGINLNFLKASKDQASSAINNLVSSSTSCPINYSNFTTTNNTATTASVTIINNNNDSKYLHKKFKKFCATVDSNHEINNSYSHSSDIKKSVVVETSSVAVLNSNSVNNNNSEIVEDKNSWSQVPSQTPRHLQTTDEEKQLVKDIIDINNENFMHQGVNYPASSFLITPNQSGASVNGGGAVNGSIVTTLGNHNTNFQLNEVRHKIVSSQEPSAFNGNFVIINSHPLSDYSFAAQQQQPAISQSTSVPTSLNSSGSVTSSSGSSTPGRYICPYCQLNCAKPSVLQKHIRAHTNERPYPCTPCGFAFKTKSNLYKHCRSRAHIQRTDPTNVGLITASTEEDGCSLESGDIDEAELLSVQNESLNHHRLSSPPLNMESQLNGNFGENSSSSSSNSSSAALYPVNSSSDTSSVNTKPYKPKFHNYKKLDLSKASALQISTAPISTPSTPSTPSFFSTNAGNLTPQIIEERISRIISDNEAIIDNVEALLQKKYHKITGIQRNLSTSSSVSNFPPTATTTQTTADQATQSNSKLALALLKQQQQQRQHDEEILKYMSMATQPLNLMKVQEPLSVDVGSGVNSLPKKKYLTENSAPLVITTQNPQEIIQTTQLVIEKPSQLVIPTSHPQNPEGSIIKDLLLNSKNFGAIDGEAGDGTYTCPTCKVSFRGAEILKYHLICHCGDESIISRSAPISPTSSSNANNNSNATSPYLPRSSSEKHSPSSLSTIAQAHLRPSAISPRTPSSLQKLAKSSLKIPKQKPENIVISPAISAIKTTPVHQQAIIKNPLPSPGPLLGNTRLVDNKRMEEEYNAKKQKLEFQSNEKKVSPFFDMKFMHEKAQTKNFPSGGSFVALEGSAEMQAEEINPNVMRPHGLSGGIALEVPVKKEPSPNDPPPITPKLIVTITPTLTPTLTTNTTLFTVGGKNHFQFPPAVTVYNPLTLPLLSTQQASGTQSIVHGGRVIPYVPGIPGPNTMSVVNKNDLPPPSVPIKEKRLNSPSMKQNGIIAPPPREISPSAMPRPNGLLTKKKSFNFARIADNLEAKGKKSPEAGETQDEVKEAKLAFLRPTSLPLKPGTFTPKQHHGITPTANTLPLISPETPRPSKSCVQLYLNGHAYTYLGLKSSTKPFYCTVNKPQPSYIQNQHKLSMYSNWQIYNGNNPNILDLSPYSAMSLYDSRQRSSKYAIAKEDKKELVCLVEMQTTKVTPSVVPTNFQVQQVTIKDELPTPNNVGTPTMINYDNNDEYTYIRGRGRGKYICQECGIRCKKPSMLKKHIRTHTDLRPYTCSYCEFSFKTKGNLTKHMKSKAHFKKCSELGISPIPTMPDDDLNDMDDCSESSRRMMMNGNTESRNESETEDNDSDDEMDDDSGDEDTDESKSRMPEHEAAQLLLSLSNHAGTRPPSENSTPMTQQQMPQNDLSVSSSVPRSRIIFSNSKPAELFDFHDLGKYYSNPSINHPKEMHQKMPHVESFDDEDDAIPMDLTKKPQAPQTNVRVSEVITKISDPAILNQLVSNTDKIPQHHHVQGTSMNFTDTIQYSENYLPSEYHMERALKDARNKQIQFSGKVSDYERLQMTPTKDQKMKLEENMLYVSKSTQQPQTSSAKGGMMDALAELAAKSDKLEVKPDESKNIAKNVASEYLKLTQQKLHRQDENSLEGSSDQETQEPATILLTPQTIVVGEDGFHKKLPTSSAMFNNDPLLYSHLQDDSGRPVCVVCQKTFQKASQLKIHMNIHYMERKYRCEACSVSFRTQGHLQKHERSVSHQNKVNMTSTFGVPTVSNPRPFKCKDCKIAFRIHGHLAKHLRSKMHVLKLECLQKLPFGTYAEMERAGFNLTDIDTSDCDNSLMSLRTLAKKLNEKDPTKLGPLPPLSNDDSADFDESGINENYDSDSSLNEDDTGMLKRKMPMDECEFENIKKIKQTESHDHVPSTTSHPNNNDDEKNACAKK